MELTVVQQICFAEGDSADKDTYAGCVEGYLSENCHDEICEIMADGGLPCTNNADTAQGLQNPGWPGKAVYVYTQVCLLGDADVTDETSYLTCIENLVSEENRDQWCDHMAHLGFPCPDADMTSRIQNPGDAVSDLSPPPSLQQQHTNWSGHSLDSLHCI